jgi:hypothetical protein
VGRHSLVETERILADECSARGSTPPTKSTLNNWLGGGRILRVWARYVVAHCKDEVEEIVNLANTPVAEKELYDRLQRSFHEFRKSEGPQAKENADLRSFSDSGDPTGAT